MVLPPHCRQFPLEVEWEAVGVSGENGNAGEVPFTTNPALLLALVQLKKKDLQSHSLVDEVIVE